MQTSFLHKHINSIIAILLFFIDFTATASIPPCTTTYSTINAAVCSTNLPYNFNGKSINAAGSYNDTLIAGSSYGCDSIITLNLTIDNSICFNWATRFGGKYVDRGNAITTDAGGNVITVGNFVDTAAFTSLNGSSTILTTPNGVRTNGFISKQDNNGNHLWVKNIYSTSVTQAKKVVTDASNNIYVSGIFAGTADFDPSAATYNLTATGGSYSGFIAKYDASGNFVWAKMIGGNAYAEIHSFKLDNNNNILMSGNFVSTVDLDPSAATNNVTSQGDYDFFVVKLDNNGEFIWAKTIGSTGTDYSTGISVDGNNNVIVTGYFNATVDFDPSAATSNLTSNTNQDIFILKLDANGNFVFAKKIGGAGYDELNCINVDAANNIYIAGDFDGTADFDPSAATNSLTSTLGASFVAKYTSNGNFVWVKKFEATDGVYIYGMDVKKNGVYFSGTYSSAFDANPNAGVNNIATLGGNTSGDIFIIKCDTSGNYAWHRAYGSTGGDYTSDITIDANDFVYATGAFGGTTCDLSGIGLSAFTFTNAGNGDGFVLKLGPPTFTWYLDADNDGYGNGTQNAASSPGTGWSTTAPANGSTDCNDNNNQVWRSANLFIDVDNDGYTNGTATVCYGATIPTGYKATSLGVDCNDNFFNAITPIATSSTTNLSICSSQLPYSWNGLMFNTAGSQIAHVTNAAGCDSAATLNLSIKNNYTITASAGTNGSINNLGVVTVCSGNNQSYTITPNNGYYVSDVLVDGISVGATTAYSFTNVIANHTIAATFGLTCVPTSSTTNKSICQSSFPYIWNGLTFNTAGSKTAHLTNAAGCDSAATLVLTINNTLPAITGGSQVCIGSNVQLINAESGGIWTSVAGKANVSNTGLVTGTSPGIAVIRYSKNGCTTATANISVNSIPLTPDIAYAPGTNIPSLRSGANFCANRSFTLMGSPNGGVWSKSGNISITTAGVVNTGTIASNNNSVTYAYTDGNGCSSSRSITANVVICASRGIQQSVVNSQWSLYPNPSTGVFNIKVEKFKAGDKVVITDILGKVVIEQNINSQLSTLNYQLSKGMYLVSVITEGGRETKKVIIE